MLCSRGWPALASALNLGRGQNSTHTGETSTTTSKNHSCTGRVLLWLSTKTSSTKSCRKVGNTSLSSSHGIRHQIEVFHEQHQEQLLF